MIDSYNFVTVNIAFLAFIFLTFTLYEIKNFEKKTLNFHKNINFSNLEKIKKYFHFFKYNFCKKLNFIEKITMSKFQILFKFRYILKNFQL